MKKSLLILTFCVSTGLAMFAQTNGILKVSVATKATGLAGKNYAPRNCMAIWIEDQSGKFVKTLLINAQKRRADLNHWKTSTNEAGSTFNATDAVSGATNTGHDTRTCSWDGRDFNGNLLPNGTYKILMELTDIDGTGNCCAYAFNKGKRKVIKSFPDRPSFAAVNLEWTPASNTISPK
jgi:hypothetical protein